nr:hypothetical protein [Tanacetum cinerariifolium]
MKLNLTQLNWDASDFQFKENYTIVHKLRAVIYRDINDQKKMMWENEMEECPLLLTDKIDLTNPEGNWVVPDVSKPLPLGDPPGQVTIQPQYFFNTYLEYLISSDKERRHALLISKLKAAYYQDFGLEELVPSLIDRNDQKKMMWENEVHKFSDITLTRIQEKLDYMVKDFRLQVQSGH